MKCPNCNETLLMSERHSVEIDYCPNCRGIWLDKGELDKLLDFASQQGNNSISYEQKDYKSEQRTVDRERHEYGDKHNNQYPRKKKSFLSDFFDFD